MKTANYIYDKYNERGMKSFEIRIAKLLKSNGITGTSIALNAWFERAGGRGSYNRVAEIEVNGETFKLTSHTNDSVAWDNFEPTSKSRRLLFEAVLEDKIDDLVEEMNEMKELA